MKDLFNTNTTSSRKTNETTTVMCRASRKESLQLKNSPVKLEDSTTKH